MQLSPFKNIKQVREKKLGSRGEEVQGKCASEQVKEEVIEDGNKPNRII